MLGVAHRNMSARSALLMLSQRKPTAVHKLFVQRTCLKGRRPDDSNAQAACNQLVFVNWKAHQKQLALLSLQRKFLQTFTSAFLANPIFARAQTLPPDRHVCQEGPAVSLQGQRPARTIKHFKMQNAHAIQNALA